MLLLDSVADALMPRFCIVCGRRLALGEKHLCLICLMKLPVIPYKNGELSSTEILLMGEPLLVRAASYFRYRKESGYSRILYHLKYFGHPEVGLWMARQAASRLVQEGFFEGVDCIIPVPLSKAKQRRRGYNQSEYIARGLSQVTGIPVEKELVCRLIDNQSQARKGGIERWENVEGIFSVRDAARLEGCHVLVVDDVITTGATISSLLETISSASNVRVSVFSLGLAG
ncbi:MAG: ComF family protein [Bacteroidaceae bacterium]|nr:ComF family protein [Bacteroidaceae bacterium]